MAPKLASTLLSQLQKEYKEIANFALNELGSEESEVNFDEPLQATTLLEFATALTQRVMREDGDLSYATRSALENFVRGHGIPAHPSEAAWKRFEALQASEAATADKRAFLRHARDLVVEALEATQQGGGGGGAGGSKGGKGGGGAGAGKGAVSLPAIKTLVQEEWEAQGGTGFDAAKVTAAVKALVLKGVVVQVGGRYHLAKGKDKPKPRQQAAAPAAAAAAVVSPPSKKPAAASAGRKPVAKPSPKAPNAAETTRVPAVARKNPLPPGPSSPAKRGGGAAAAAVAAKPAVSKSPAYKAAGAAAGATTPAAAPRGKAAAKAAAKPRQARAGTGRVAAAATKGRAGAKAGAAGGVKKTPTKKAAATAAKPRASKAAAAAKAAVTDAGVEAAEPPEVVDGKPMWKIEKFVSLRKGRGRGKRMLRVRWQGWSADDDTWLPERQLVEDLGAEGFAELLQELEAAGGVRGSKPKAKAVKVGRGSKATAVKGGVAKGGSAQKRAGAGAAPKRGGAAAGAGGKK